jgi:hypothetical protein
MILQAPHKPWGAAVMLRDNHDRITAFSVAASTIAAGLVVWALWSF